MTAKKDTKEDTEKPLSEKDVLKNLEPFSTALKKTVEQVWKIFVRRYIAKGVSELFIAGCITAVSLVLLWGDHKMWLWLPLPVVTLLIFDAIQLLINPAYFAIGDVEAFVKRQQKATSDVAIINNHSH